jgi:hypothetical protein
LPFFKFCKTINRNYKLIKYYNMKSFICFVHNVVINLPIYFNSYMLLSCDFMYLYRIVVNVSITFFLCVSLYIFFRGSYYSIFSFICMFCRSLFVLLYFFSFGHCDVCSSSICGFWVPFGILKLFLANLCFE